MNADLLLQFLSDPAWDAPFFKRLAHNDTGQAIGHQGGVVVPRDLRAYFPALDEGLASAIAPTVDRYLIVDMFVPGQQVGSDMVRYQFQTWGGTRSAESRLTDNLGPIRNRAQRGDLFIMQRSRDRLDSFRLVLVRQTDRAFARINALTQGRRWGSLFVSRPPISQEELVVARTEMLRDTERPFVAVRENVPRVATSRQAIARDTAFRETLLTQYRRRCAVSGIALATHSLAEAEAAHVIPIGRGGADEPRNGLTLTRTLHWAFDRGLFGVGDDRRVLVPTPVRTMPENSWLVQFHDRPIVEALMPSLQTAREAFAWHRSNLLAQWS
ncbi:MAG: HNH endonuclease [Terrimicrobiaceae bacterium]|nr:HNH endonuclease [Terrimicrobiaceae bacterium]